MRTSLAILCCLGVASVSEAAPARWSIGPPHRFAVLRAPPKVGLAIQMPAGWTDVTAQVTNEPAVVAQRKKLTALDADTDMQMYQHAEGYQVQVLVTAMSAKGHKPTWRAIRQWEAGARSGAGKAGTEASYNQRMVGDTLVVDHAIDAPAGHIESRRIIGADRSDRMVAVSATCLATHEVCTPILATLALERAELVPPSLDDDDDDRSTAFKMGRLAGYVFLAVLIGVVIWRARKRKQSPAA